MYYSFFKYSYILNTIMKIDIAAYRYGQGGGLINNVMVLVSK